MQRFRVLTIAALFAALAVACGGGDDGDAISITATDNAFEPSSITASAGDSIEVTNDGQALHNFSVDGTDVDFDIQAGETETEDAFEGLEPGTYEIVCKYHVAEGMTGTLTIEG